MTKKDGQRPFMIDKSWGDICNKVKKMNLPVSIRQDYNGYPICTNCRACVLVPELAGVDKVECSGCKTTFVAFTDCTPGQLDIVKVILNDKIPIADRNIKHEVKGAICDPAVANDINLVLPESTDDIVDISEEIKEIDHERNK